MEYDELFKGLSICFAPVNKKGWEYFTVGARWSDFLDATRRILQDGDAFGAPTSPIARVRNSSHCPLQEFLSGDEVQALFAPPTYEEKQGFAARHFVGGLPDSALPVESLYVTWSRSCSPSPFPRGIGMYQSDVAQYMRDIVERMNMRFPPEFVSYPDHLALELDLISVMLRSGMRDVARAFFIERFAWLTAYRIRLLELQERATFYVGLIDILLGIRAQLGLDCAELPTAAS